MALLQGGAEEISGAVNIVGTPPSTNISVTVDAGANRCLVLCISGEGDGTSTQAEVSSAVRDGQSLTRHARVERSDWSWTEVWVLVAPNTGTANLTVTLTESDQCSYGVYVADDVNQSTPLRAATTASGSGTATGDQTVAGVAAGDLVFDSLALDSTGAAPVQGADQTEQWEITGGASSHMGASSTQPGSAGGVMSYSWTGSRPYSYIGTAFVDAGSAGVQLAAAIASRGQVAAAVQVEKPLGALIVSRGQVAAALRVEKPLAAALASRGQVTGALSVPKQLAAVVGSVGRMVAALDTGAEAIVTRLRTLLGVGE